MGIWTGRQAGRWTNTGKKGQACRQVDRQTRRWTDMQAGKWTHRKVGMQTGGHRWAGRQVIRQICRQRGRQVG